ncbi:MAG TPA: hypothetical protein PL110_05340 [Candidatus Eremiobacteraeota bacterium]|nr:MAG: hypothetical protein BWY64_01355 [bacterium ADurb.Bin363]HPZ07515.1 hypothetical protein [Candidatus Eremiobacteraeota bacterium]
MQQEVIIVDKTKNSIKFRLGLLLLIANFPIGYGGLAISTGIGAKTGENFWYLLAGGFYALSWIMMGAGILLAGPEGVKRAKKILSGIFKRPKT